MIQNDRFRTALVGCGRISAIHIAALKALPDVDIVAVCDLNDKLAHAQAVRHNIPGVYTDMERMMSKIQPDVVHLLTPPRTHVALARIAAQHQAHIYVEKPLASSEVDARSILDAAQKVGVHLCPGPSLLFDPLFLRACRRIDTGEIGQVVSIRAEQGFTYEAVARSTVIPWSYTYDWGIFENLIPPPLYLACHFLNNPGEPQVVGFNLGQVREATVEEIRVLIPSASAIAEVSLSLCTSPEVNRLEVVGTRGRMLVDFNTLTLLSSRHNGLPSLVNRFTSNFRMATSLIWSGAGVIFGIITGKVKPYMGLRALISAFYASLRKGVAPPVQPERGLLNVRLMDQIRNACDRMVKQRGAKYAPAQLASAPRILVTGASGFLGGHLVERLSSEQIPVRGTTRVLSRARLLPAVEWVRCDLTKEEEVRNALAGVETILHCAALTDPPGSIEDYEEVNVKGTVRLASLAAEAGVKHLIYISSLMVYGNPSGHTSYLDETAPYDRRAVDRGVYTQSKLAAEKALLEYVAEHNRPRVVVLRAGTIYGPGAKLPVGRFQLPSPSKRPVIAGSRRVPMPLTYIDNLIDAMLAAARSEVPTGSVYNIVDSADANQGKVARTLCEVSQGRIQPLFLSCAFVWSLMLSIDLLSLMRQSKLGTARFRLKRTLANMRFKCSAARKDLGWEPRVSLADGLARAVEASTPFSAEQNSVTIRDETAQFCPADQMICD